MENFFMVRNQQLPGNAPSGSAVFQTLFLYEHGAVQDFTVNAGDYPSFDLAAQTELVAHADVLASPFQYTCTAKYQFLTVFARLVVNAPQLDNFVAAFRINNADVVHAYLGIGNEIRLWGGVWMLQNDTLTMEIRAYNRTASTQTLTLENVVIGAAPLQYLPPSALVLASD
jgi:hypothetical protein